MCVLSGLYWAEDKVICLTEGVDHLSFDTLRQPDFPFSQKIIGYSDEQLLQAVEKEDRELAESLVFSYFKI